MIPKGKAVRNDATDQPAAPKAPSALGVRSMWRRRQRRLVRLLGRLLPAGVADRILTVSSRTAQGLLTQPS